MNDFVISCVFAYLNLFLLDLYYFIIVLYLNDSTLWRKNTVGSAKAKRRRQGGSLTWIKQYMPKRKKKEEFDNLRNTLVRSLTER